MKNYQPPVLILWGTNSAGLPQAPYYTKFPGDWDLLGHKTEQEALQAALDMRKSMQQNGIAGIIARKDMKPIKSS